MVAGQENNGDRFYQYGLILIQPWISNYIYYKEWDDVIHSQTSAGQPLKFGKG